MALHTELPIYKTGVQLLTLAVKVQEQMPRGVKRSLGDKIAQHCVEMLDLMALANATQKAERAEHIGQLMKHLRASTVLLRVSHVDRARIANVLRHRGRCVSGALTKSYRPSKENA